MKEEKAVASAASSGNDSFSLISNEKLVQLYTSMVKCRMLNERMRLLSCHLKLAGNHRIAALPEAASVGVVIDLLSEDAVVSSRGEVIVHFLKGQPLNLRMQSLLSRNAAVETADRQLAAAVDKAKDNKMKKNSKIVAVFGRTEADSSEVWHRAFCVADAEQLPMLFASYSAVPTQPANASRLTGVEENVPWPHSFPSIPVDASDVVAVYRVATEAIAHARKGNGASLVECVSHSTGNPSELDPVLRMEIYLNRKGLFTEELKHEVATSFSVELEAAVESLAAQPSPCSSRLAI